MNTESTPGASAYKVVIPARFDSQRLPGKALLDIHGKPMIQRVWECAAGSSAEQVVIATDSERICSVARAFGAEVVMTASHHTSGSDRIAECADRLNWKDSQVIVNLQGDEPLMPAACLDQVASLLEANPAADAASLYWPVETAEQLVDPNVVKVVTTRQGVALMFSRAVLPYPRGYPSISAAFEAGLGWYRHIGLYAYRAGSLRRFSRTPPMALELVEHLEQLRYLESGGKIVLRQACREIPAGVDTMDDLCRVQNLSKEF